MNIETTPVIFRVDSDGNVFALFPTIPADIDGKYCQCYQHVGQHSSADYVGCIASSRPATPMEFDNLKRELENIGYKLRFCWRSSQFHRAAFNAELQRIRSFRNPVFPMRKASAE